MPEAKSAVYRLTPRARADLEEIWVYTADTWSSAQVDRYLAGLAKTFELLADMPEIARERTEFMPPVRLHPHQAHLIVCRVEVDHILVVRVPSGREDWAALISEAGFKNSGM
jgi:toxin ParE1/3/4